MTYSQPEKMSDKVIDLEDNATHTGEWKKTEVLFTEADIVTM